VSHGGLFLVRSNDTRKGFTGNSELPCITFPGSGEKLVIECQKAETILPPKSSAGFFLFALLRVRMTFIRGWIRGGAPEFFPRDILYLAMTVVVSMLRAVNLGGHNKIKMEALRALYESLKFEDVATFIQSGNVVFRTKEQDLGKVCKKIGDGIEKTFGFRPNVILRTAEEMRGVIARNPFADRKEVEPNRLLVWFLTSEPDAEARKKALAVAAGVKEANPEELRMDGREIYIYFPNGMARPKLSMPAVERALKVSGTGRNWNSVLKLMEMCSGTKE
jgi:uncharacterized protein (DUF1697 family)